MSKIKLLIKYLFHKLVCRGPAGHGIHSPFIFGFNRDIINSNKYYPEYDDIVNYRNKLGKNREIINVSDYGAGSRVFRSRRRIVSDISRHSASSLKTGKLLFRLVRYFRPGIILELGTSLGFGTFCLAKGDDTGRAQLFSIEGCPEQHAIAGRELRSAGILHPVLICGRFEDELPKLLNNAGKLDFVYFDGDHRKEPVLWQFRQCLAKAVPGTIFVIGDIHWSDEMEEAWEELCRDSSVSLSIDLYYCGLLFFREDIAKQMIRLCF